jgi:putative NIF3 family GTP cyclohydrolase 1 type 2
MAVAWMGTMDAMVQAHGSGCNVLVVHEPIYFNHFDHYGPVEHDPGFQAKKAFLDKTGMVVYRCHDVWDYVPVIGVRDSWAALLGMAPGDSSSWEGKQNARVYQLAEPLKIGELSQGIVEKVKPYGQGYVRIAGDPEKEISRLGLGTGMVHGIQVLRSFQEHGADAVVATELMEWRDVHWALENGLSIIHLSHGVSESKGIENLAAYLQKLFPKIEVIYIPSGNNPYSVFMP